MTTSQPSSSFLILFSRAFWIMLGPLLLMVLLANIVFAGTSWISTLDLFFFLTLGGVVLARWIEFRGGGALTATGDPATAANLRHYMLGAVVLGMIAWIVANVLGNHWLVG